VKAKVTAIAAFDPRLSEKDFEKRVARTPPEDLSLFCALVDTRWPSKESGGRYRVSDASFMRWTLAGCNRLTRESRRCGAS